MSSSRQFSLWLDKAEYLETLARRYKDDAALRLVHQFMSVFLQIRQLWLAYCEAPLLTVESLGQHLRNPLDGELYSLSEAATYFRLDFVHLNFSDFHEAGEDCAVLMQKSEDFRNFLRQVDEKLREFAARSA